MSRYKPKRCPDCHGEAPAPSPSSGAEARVCAKCGHDRDSEADGEEGLCSQACDCDCNAAPE